MIFAKQFLADLEDSDADNVKIIEDKFEDTSRWSIAYRRVFEFNHKFYVTYYSVGATECQDEGPYEYDPDEIECPEVFPTEVSTTVYKTAKELGKE